MCQNRVEKYVSLQEHRAERTEAFISLQNVMTIEEGSSFNVQRVEIGPVCYSRRIRGNQRNESIIHPSKSCIVYAYLLNDPEGTEYS